MKSFRLKGYKFNFTIRRDWGTDIDFCFKPEDKLYIIIEIIGDKISTKEGIKNLPIYYAYDELKEIVFNCDSYKISHQFDLENKYFDYPYDRLGYIRRSMIQLISNDFDEIKKKTDYLNLL